MSIARRILVLLLSLVLLSTCTAYGEKTMTYGYFFYPAGTTEEQAGILTETASNSIKKIILQYNLVNIDSVLEPYLRRLHRISYYDDSNGTQRMNNFTKGTDYPTLPVGTTKYTKEYSNSGIFTYRTTSGIYAAIINSTISYYLGSVVSVGNILSWVYSVISGVGPDTQKLASAKTMYSYRYTTEKGWVYECMADYDYYPRATVVSRETCQHYWGQYIDMDGFARQCTRDLGVFQTDDAPHKGNSTWIKQKAREMWQGGLPHYYEDWQ